MPSTRALACVPWPVSRSRRIAVRVVWSSIRPGAQYDVVEQELERRLVDGPQATGGVVVDQKARRQDLGQRQDRHLSARCARALARPGG